MNAAIADVREALGHALDLLPDAMDTPEAATMLLAIGLQESALTQRVQVSPRAPGGRGPARGLLQFEKGGGATGVCNHQASRFWMSRVCAARKVGFTPTAVWMALETDDVLAFAAGRLLLFTDPKRLPELGDEQGAWNLYIRCWRPGKPSRDRWADSYAQALEAVREIGGE